MKHLTPSLLPIALTTAAVSLTSCAAGGIDTDGMMTYSRSAKSGGGFVTAPTAKVFSASSASSLPRSASFSGSLQSGDQMLSDNTYADFHEYAGEPGDLVRVSMQSSDFDAFVMVLAQDSDGNISIIADDDDSGDGLNAETLVEIPDDASILIAANSSAAGETGTYRLNIESEGFLEIPEDSGSGRYALLVGLGDYPVGQDNDLASGRGDLDLVRTTLIERYGFADQDILVLPDARATRNSVIRGFREHLSRAGSDGTAFFFYTGHGARVEWEVNTAEEDGFDDALVLADNLLLDDEVGILVDELSSRNTMVVIDACHSGTGSMLAGDVRSKEILAGDLSPNYTRPKNPLTGSSNLPEGSKILSSTLHPSNHVLMASSTENQLSLSFPQGALTEEYASSLFTVALTQAMRNSSDEMTMTELMLETERLMLGVLNQIGDEQDPQILGTRIDESAAAFLGSK